MASEHRLSGALPSEDDNLKLAVARAAFTLAIHESANGQIDVAPVNAAAPKNVVNHHSPLFFGEVDVSPDTPDG
jgi:hypothetical protein